MEQNFFFYDLETSGLNPRADRIMQFAGQRTDMNLVPTGDPVNILVKMTEDALPSPCAINVTGITPQMTLADGLSEPEFCRYILENVFAPNTIAVGYNTVRFDDEFMRALFWRNFQDPYEYEWKDGRSRWDILDIVRLTRALRPEGIEWPFTPEGKPTNRLELITKLNGISHEHAHDALSDVYATIAVAKLIRDHQPKLFEFLLKMRDKRAVKKLINLEDKKPFVYASGRYDNKYNKTTVAVPIAPGRNGNVLVYDLRYNLSDLLEKENAAESEQDPSKAGKNKTKFFPIVKELCYNKCPAVAPLGVLDSDDGWQKISLDKGEVEKNLNDLFAHPEFAERMRSLYEARPEWPQASEPEAALYDGFLNDKDRNLVGLVRSADTMRLADLHPEFDDERLPELLLHYKGRNFPESLSDTENEEWEKYRRARLESQAPKFLEELNKVTDDFTREELKLYFQSLM
ncbi:exodeoxyribonuclease I [Candidatus Saccharibacteria bacterium]|nr:exodeoxyribonuclease I [Candidatus Saccharibacteria bacterium]